MVRGLVVGGKVVIDSSVNNPFSELAHKRQEGDRAVTFEEITIKLKRFENRHYMGLFESIKRTGG